MYNYSPSQIFTGIGILGIAIGTGFAGVSKMLVPFLRIRNNGGGDYVPRNECATRHEAEIQRHKEVKLELSKLFNKSDETQKGVAEIKGILKGMTQ